MAITAMEMAAATVAIVTVESDGSSDGEAVTDNSLSTGWTGLTI